MSQAVIDFCEGLKTTLLGLEDRLGKAQSALAQTSLAKGASRAGEDAKKHLAEASEQLQQFKAHAGLMAQAIRAELPEQAEIMKEKLSEFGQEAQVAMRHAIVFLAEAASKGAISAAGALQTGAHQAKRLAEELRHDTALAAVPETEAAPPATSA